MLQSSCWHRFASSLVIPLLLTPWLHAEPAASDEVSRPVRVADLRPVERVFPGTSHSHPGICVTRSGAIVVVHYVENAGLVLIARSTDGGRTWSKSTPVPGVNCKCYPGALTTLSDGRILVNWNCWSKDLQTRCPHVALSRDEGKTWSEPAAFPWRSRLPAAGYATRSLS